MVLTDDEITGLQLGGIFTLFIALFLLTIATAANSWQTSNSRNYYFNIGIWKWCAISKVNDNSTVCGDVDKDELYAKDTQQNGVEAMRILTCFTTGMVAFSMLLMLGNKPIFAYLSAFSALLSMILAITTVIVYSEYVWKKAELDNLDSVTPNDPDWKYGFSYWFFITAIILLLIAFIILLVLGKGLRNASDSYNAESDALLGDMEMSGGDADEGGADAEIEAPF